MCRACWRWTKALTCVCVCERSKTIRIKSDFHYIDATMLWYHRQRWSRSPRNDTFALHAFRWFGVSTNFLPFVTCQTIREKKEKKLEMRKLFQFDSMNAFDDKFSTIFVSISSNHVDNCILDAYSILWKYEVIYVARILSHSPPSVNNTKRMVAQCRLLWPKCFQSFIRVCTYVAMRWRQRQRRLSTKMPIVICCRVCWE